MLTKVHHLTFFSSLAPLGNFGCAWMMSSPLAESLLKTNKISNNQQLAKLTCHVF